MIKLPYNSCFGCYGCFNVCPKNAIEVKPDMYGYMHPDIDTTKCIECHLCEKVCTVYHPQPLNPPKKVLAVVTKNKSELKSVASGGVCTILGREIIRRDGVVYGCYEENYHSIRHVRIDKDEDLDLLKRSKYVHSEIGNAFRLVKKDLEKGLEVLFIGTPCQVSGLYGYLRKTYENLHTVDMVCHGVPSQKMLCNQIELYYQPWMDNFKKGSVQFRWKDSRYGICYGIRFNIDNSTIKQQSEWRSPYMAAFSYGISYRENCYSCPFACGERVADITAADFWGLGKEVPSQFNAVDGVSMVLINTDNGARLFDTVKDCFMIESHTLEEASCRNANLRHPAPRPDRRDEFLRLFKERGIKAAAYACVPKYRKMCNPIYRYLISNKIVTKSYTIVKNILKK